MTAVDPAPETTPEPTGRWRARRWGRIGGVAAAATVAVVITGWAADSALGGDSTRRNIAVADVAVGGLSPTEFDAVLADMANAYESVPVTLDTGNEPVTVPAVDAGLSLDTGAIAAAVRSVDGSVAPVARPFNWLGSLFTTTNVPISVVVDPDTLAASPLGELAEASSVPATEPTVEAEGSTMVAVPGVDGNIVTTGQVAEAIAAGAVAADGGAVSVVVEPEPAAPSISDDEAAELAFLATSALNEPVTVVVDTTSFELAPEDLAGWLVTNVNSGRLELGIDTSAAIAGLNELAPQLGAPEVPVQFAVNGGVVSFSGGAPGTICCEPDTVERLILALSTDERVALLESEPKPLERGPQWAEDLKITTPIGSFTTNYPAGQDRAINIVRIAEILRGTVIEPGETFSVNGSTGPRTREQGFVDGGIIINGELSTGVGGGISQYATTLFNAAFFAGLDIPDYMMHTLYISRYPYGREATLAYNSVDLKITNNTPYGVLLWSESTPDSITVTLYSTPWVTGEQTGQSESAVGACTRVATQRTRTWLTDGRTATDTFFATYQPEEGVLC